MRDFVEDAINRIRGTSLSPHEVEFIMQQVRICTVMGRKTDSELDAVLLNWGVRLIHKGSKKGKMSIARRMLLEYGVPEEQLDELLVMATLGREDE